MKGISWRQVPARLAEAWRHPADRGAEAAARREMVAAQLCGRGITDLRVLAAMAKVPRQAFVPPALRGFAYEDGPLPIGHGQTISQPYIVALMTELLALAPDSRVLEIGTGSGYQTAVLAELAGAVYTVEIIAPLARQAQATLAGLGYRNIHCQTGDGHDGWPAAAPFDAVIVTCAPERIPPPLVAQLREGGQLVIPVGEENRTQELVLLTKRGGEIRQRSVTLVRFVPLVRNQP